MPRRYFSISTIDLLEGASVDELITEVNEKIVEINEALSYLELLESKLRGEDGNLVTFSNNIDMQGNRITNAARSNGQDDAITRREIIERGFFQTQPGKAVTSDKSIVLTGGATITIPPATSGNQAVTLAQVLALINTAVEQAAGQVRDGTEISLQGSDGVIGTTKGSLVFGTKDEDGTEKAKPIRVGPSGIQASDGKAQELLELTIDVLSSIDGRLVDASFNRGSGEGLSAEQLTLIIANELEKELATIRDGSTVDLEDIDGTIGDTKGTLLFATTLENGVVKARPLRIGAQGVQFSDGRTQELLELLLERLILIDASLERLATINTTLQTT